MLGALFTWIGLHYVKSLFKDVTAMVNGSIQKADGIIVGHNSRTAIVNRRKKIVYAPIYEFEIDGQSHHHECTGASSFAKSIGTEVKIYYNRSDDSVFTIGNLLIKFVMIIFLIGFGALMILNK